jgi:hypothetical protein
MTMIVLIRFVLSTYVCCAGTAARLSETPPRLGVLRHRCLIKMTPKGETDESRHRTKKMEVDLEAPQGASPLLAVICFLSRLVVSFCFISSTLSLSSHRAQLAWPCSSAVFPVSTSLSNSTYPSYRLCSDQSNWNHRHCLLGPTLDIHHLSRLILLKSVI